MPDKVREKSPNTPTPENAAVLGRIVDILEEARSHVARTINSAMVVAYWLIGREIVEEEQKGQKRADYGKALLQDLSRRLNNRYGGGFSVTTLQDCRKFYLTYVHRLAIQHPPGAKFTMPAIGYPVGRELGKSGNPHPPGGELTPKQRPTGVEFATGFHPDLSWSHYRALMRVENEEARQFYEQEIARNHWNKRQLERQINTLLFERLLKSRDKDGVLQHANEGQATEHPINIIKDPYALEFLGLPESHRLLESDLEAALTTHMQEFLLELGAGFAFVARQKRLTLDGDHFYADLVFYHVEFRWFGKANAKRNAFTPTLASLEYDHERSVNPELAEGNAIIEGENLEVLKCLLASYRNRVKCIYIDPPYNIEFPSLVCASRSRQAHRPGRQMGAP